MVYYGWKNEIVAEARTRLDQLYGACVQYDRIMNDAQAAEQYNKEAGVFYLAAREKLVSMRIDLESYHDFIRNNAKAITDASENYDFYENEYEALDKLLEAYEVVLITPTAISATEVETGWFEGIVDEVEDADTIVVGGRKIRFAGVDAPESGTPRGAYVKQRLTDFLLGKKVRIMVDPYTQRDLYGRVLGVPYLIGENGAEDIDVCVWLLERCLAAPNNKFGKHHYVDAARNKALGEKCIYDWPMVGTCEFTSKPTHAQVFIDGVYRDRTPCKITIPIGVHRFTLCAPNASSVSEIRDVKPEEITLPTYILPDLPASTGTVQIIVEPHDASAIVYKDGAPFGVAPLVVDLPSDVPTELTVRAAGYVEQTGSVVAQLGSIVKAVFKLEREKT